MRTHRLGLTTRMLLSLAGSGALGFLAAVGPVGAEPGDGIATTGATVDRVGWWHQNNVATDLPAGPVTLPPPPGVPAGTVAVGAIDGDPDRIAALGIVPDAVPGDTPTELTLTITEAEPPAVQANSGSAGIVACPITEFWVPAENGTWANRPVWDCDIASASGERDDDGTWTFDLLPIAEAWLDPSGSLVPDGIVLVEEVESPGAFQTVFATEEDGAGSVVYAGTAGPTTTLSTLPPTVDTAPSDTAPIDVPDVGTGEVPVSDLPTPDAPTTSAAPTTEAPLATGPIATTSPNVLGNLPGGLIVAVPTFIVLMGLLSFSLGPAGEPVEATRQGGVSRALAARAAHTRSVTPEDR